MVHLKRNLLLALLPLLIASCASRYKSIKLQDYTYRNRQVIVDSIYGSYVTSIQRISDNGWYAKKENNRGRIALGVKIENHTSVPLVIEREYVAIYGDGVKKEILTADDYSAKVRQRTWQHLILHSLYNLVLYAPNGDVIYLPVGTLVGLTNTLKARKANRANAADMKRLEIWNKTVPAHGELYGVILLKGSRFEEFTIKFEVGELE